MTLPTLDGFTKKVADLLDRPNTQMTAIQLKDWFDAAPNELRVFLNARLAQIDTDFALKSEINGVTLGQIVDGSLTDVKLSNDTGQVKERLSGVITDLSNFIATKGVANGFASLDGNGKLPSSQKGISIVTGTISNGGTIPQTAGYANYRYFVSVNSAVINDDNSYDWIATLSCSVDQSTRVVTLSVIGGKANSYGTVNYMEIAW